MPKYLIYGEEPYLIDKFREALIKKVETPEFNLLDTNEFGETEKAFLCQYPLLGDKKTLIFRVGKLTECTELIEFIAVQGKRAEVYIFCNEADRRTKVFKSFKKEEIKVYNKLPQETLEKTIAQYIKKAGCEITSEAYRLFLQLVNYDSEDTNLYDVLHSLKRICAVKTITKDVVESMVMDREKEDIFSLIRLIMNRQYGDVFRQADLLLRSQPNNVIGILSLLLRSYRIAYKMQRCNCSLQELGINYRTFVPRLSAEQCSQAMDILDGAVNKVKRGFYKSEIALKTALAKLCEL